jgi:hypothetical protein
MFQNYLSQYAQLPASGYSENIYTRQYNVALSHFRSVLRNGADARLKRRFCIARPPVRSGYLEAGAFVYESFTSIQVVRINSIIGRKAV